MTKKIFTTGFVLLGLSSQVFGLGSTQLLETTGESLSDSLKTTVKSNATKTVTETTKESDSQSTVESTKGSGESVKGSGKTSSETSQDTTDGSLKNSPEYSSKSVKGFFETTGDTTEWLVCANKCQKLLDDQALVPAAKDYLVGVDVAAMDMEKFYEFAKAVREENPELNEKYPLDEQAQNEVFNKGLALALVQGNFNNL